MGVDIDTANTFDVGVSVPFKPYIAIEGLQSESGILANMKTVIVLDGSQGK